MRTLRLSNEGTPMRHYVVLTIFLTFHLASAARADKLVLLAGGGTETNNVPATKAKLDGPFGVDFDSAGNMYIVEFTGQRLLRVDAKGMLTVLAGTGKKGDSGDDGPAAKATFNSMHSLLVAPNGIYLADTWNNRIRVLIPLLATSKVSPVVLPFAGTGKKGYAGDGDIALKAEFTGIYSLAFNKDRSELFLADLENRRIRFIDMKTGIVDTFAGNGKKGVPADGAEAKTAPLVDPRAVAVDRHALRVVDRQGKIRTVAGTGNAGSDLGDALKAQLSGPKHLCIDLDDNVIIADSGNHRIVKYSPRDSKVTLVAGTGKKGESGNGGPALEVPLNEPHGVCVNAAGVLYIVDSNNNRVFRLEK
jgi:hypothetical protein